MNKFKYASIELFTKHVEQACEGMIKPDRIFPSVIPDIENPFPCLSFDFTGNENSTAKKINRIDYTFELFIFHDNYYELLQFLEKIADRMNAKQTFYFQSVTTQFAGEIRAYSVKLEFITNNNSNPF